MLRLVRGRASHVLPDGLSFRRPAVCEYPEQAYRIRLLRHSCRCWNHPSMMQSRRSLRHPPAFKILQRTAIQSHPFPCMLLYITSWLFMCPSLLRVSRSTSVVVVDYAKPSLKVCSPDSIASQQDGGREYLESAQQQQVNAPN